MDFGLKQLSELNVLVVGYLAGHSNEPFVKYLVPRTNSVAFIGLQHQHFGDRPRSYLYSQGRFLRNLHPPGVPHFELGALYKLLFPVIYFWDISWIVITIVRIRKKYDLLVAVAVRCAFAGSIAKLLGFTRKLVYYTSDYLPFSKGDSWETAFSKGAWKIMDRFCLRFADVVWNPSPVMTELRRRNNEHEACFTVPPTMNPMDHPNESPGPTFVIIGWLRKGLGLEMVFNALPRIAKEIPSIKIRIIGSGRESAHYEKLCKEEKLEKHVEFTGFIQKLAPAVSDCMAGIAVYDLDDPVKTSFPSKVKTYLELGLPVIMTDITYFASEVKKSKVGVVIDYDEDEFSEAIKLMILKHQDMRRNISSIYQRYSPETVFGNCLKETLEVMDDI